MNIFAKKTILHHFKVCFPLPLEKAQNCLKNMQHLNPATTAAVCISLNGQSNSPQNCQLLYDSIINVREINRLPIYTFLEDKATATTYFTSTAGQKIHANPYALIGDIGTPQKSYRNIKKLLDLLGIKYQELGSTHESSRIWNQFVEKTSRQEQTTHKWLELIEKNMINSISERRGISKEALIEIKSNVFHPKDALKHKLIDSVSTFEEFVNLHYPNSTIENYVYKIDGKRLRHNFSDQEMTALNNFVEVLEMPQVALMSINDPVKQSLNELFGLLQTRLMGEDSLESLECLEEWLGGIFARLEGQQEYRGLMFEL